MSSRIRKIERRYQRAKAAATVADIIGKTKPEQKLSGAFKIGDKRAFWNIVPNGPVRITFDGLTRRFDDYRTADAFMRIVAPDYVIGLEDRQGRLLIGRDGMLRTEDAA